MMPSLPSSIVGLAYIRQPRPGVPHRQAGLSLVEIMISMVLALVLLLGLSIIFTTTWRSFGTQSGLAELQEKQRNAVVLLNGVIQSAGYFPAPSSQVKLSDPAAIRKAFFAASTNSTYTAGSVIFGTDSTTDTVQVRFQTGGGENIPNCQGDTNTGAGKTTYDNVFSLNNSKQLVCAVGIDGAAPGASVVLVDGISNMQILYGVDTTGLGSATQYLSANAVGDWSLVHSVKIQLTFDNPNAASDSSQPASVQTTQVIHLIGNR